MKKVAIIGNGWVGKAMKDLFPDALTYVREFKGFIDKRYTTDKELINECDIAFICVPTPNVKEEIPFETTDTDLGDNGIGVAYTDGEGALDTSAVEECIEWLETPLIVVRSTVNPGDCDRWQVKYKKNILMQPEYLGETPQHPLLNTLETPFLILGGNSYGARRSLIQLYQTVYNANVTIRQVSLLTAEIIKLSENRAIAFKVAQAQELYDVCELANVDYFQVRDAVYGDDPRFNLWWTFIYPEKRGFQSKCIPKDIYAWCAWAESLGYEPKITRMILEKNKEWINESESEPAYINGGWYNGRQYWDGKFGDPGVIIAPNITDKS